MIFSFWHNLISMSIQSTWRISAESLLAFWMLFAEKSVESLFAFWMLFAVFQGSLMFMDAGRAQEMAEKMSKMKSQEVLQIRQNQQNDICAQQRLRSAWESTQSDQSSLSARRRFESLVTYKVHSEDCSDWAVAQADLSLCWMHMLLYTQQNGVLGGLLFSACPWFRHSEIPSTFNDFAL